MAGDSAVRALRTALGGLAQALLPPLCPLCRKSPSDGGTSYCSGCSRLLEPLIQPYCLCCALPFWGTGPSHPCPRCREEPPPFRELRAWGIYRGTLLESIHGLKYRRQLWLRGALESLALEVFDAHWGKGAFEAVVPVPPHAETLRRRGFDLPTLVARHLARERSVPWRPRVLTKSRRTPDLVGLNVADRARTVVGVFLPRERLDGEVLLVDDVATSTATARACAAACLEAGASAVSVLVLARTPMEAR